MKFKDFLKEDAFHDAEDFLHHIAEEEFPACNINEIKLLPNGDVAFVGDCNDRVREEGYQEDLTAKLKIRLSIHPIKGLGVITPRVYHKNIPENDSIQGVK